MKLGQNEFTATLAILAAGILGGSAPIAAKYALQELTPLTVLFIRLTFMLLAMLPVIILNRRHLLMHWKRLAILGLFWTGNVTLFIIGVKYTTSAISQVMYALVPIIIVIANYFTANGKIKITQLVGIFFGLVGAILLVMLSKNAANHLGSPFGNSIILLAACCWASYLMYSKTLGNHLSSSSLTAASSIVAWIGSLVFLVVFEGLAWTAKISTISTITWSSLLFLGIANGCFMIFLFQWGVKHGSSFMASTNVYETTIVSAIAGYFFFGEQLTPTALIGGLFLLIGLFLTSIAPLLQKKSQTAV